MSKRNGEQKGAQMHAEGQHGAKTHARFLEQLHEGGREQRLSAEEARADGSRIAAQRGRNGSPPRGK